MAKKEVDTTGYIGFYRKAMKEPFYKDSKAVHLFLHCLLMANFTDTRGEIGTFVTTRDELAEMLGWKTHNTVDKFLKILKKHNMIDYSTKNNNTKIVVKNYKKYQAKK